MQTFDSNGDGQLAKTDEYIDLVHWIMLFQAQTSDSTMQSALSSARQTLASLVIYERHQSGSYVGTSVLLTNAYGVAIYYPPQGNVTTYQRYAHGDLSFPGDTGWISFLASGLDALPLGTSEAIDNPVAPQRLPGAIIFPRIYLPSVQR